MEKIFRREVANVNFANKELVENQYFRPSIKPKFRPDANKTSFVRRMANCGILSKRISLKKERLVERVDRSDRS